MKHVTNRTSLDMTSAQKMIWTGQQLHPDTTLYNMALAYTIDGPIDETRFATSLQVLVDHCDSMRTVFDQDTGRVQQYVLETLPVELEQIDFSHRKDPDAAFRTWATARCSRPLDLSKKTFDTALVKLGAERFAWFYNQHHIATDASSFAQIFRRVHEIYDAPHGNFGEVESLPQFRSYVTFERENVARVDSARKWFASRSKCHPPRLYGKKYPTQSTATRRVTWHPDPKLVKRFRDLAMQPGIRGLTRHASQFQLIATVLFALLYRISGQKRIAIGTPSHNRTTRDFKQSIGLFIEVFPFSAELEANESFQSLLQKVKAETMAFIKHAQPAASDSRDQRSFNTLLNYITAGFGDFGDLATKSDWLHAGHCDGGHLLRIQVHDFDAQGEIVFHFDLNNQFFDEELGQTCIGHFEKLFRAAIYDLQQEIDSVDLLSSRERMLQIQLGSGPTSEMRAPQTVIDQFMDVVAEHGATTAIQDKTQSLTYAELNDRVDGVADQLRRKGVEPEDLVVMHLPRSIAAVVSILAIHKLGAAFVPIDAANPARRIKYLLKDAGRPLVITTAAMVAKIPNGTRSLCLSENGQLVGGPDGEQDNNAAVSAENTSPLATPDQVAYVIYTSGSTGEPKGVMITHANLEHYISWACDTYCKGERPCFPLFSPLAFDLTITSLFLPLVTGGKIVVYPEVSSGADLGLLDVVEDNLVDIIKLTPSHLSLLSGSILDSSRVKQLILGGEDLRCDTARQAHSVFGDQIKIHNEYGPTEATVGCIVHTFDPSTDRVGSVPIGRPIRDMQAYVLNDAKQPVPRGVVGELYLGGKGLAREYLGRPELTKRRFVENPFVENERLYRTGDLARIRSDGTFEYFGRIDQQVKVRGVRIELGEIESAITAHPKIETCVADVVDSASRQTELPSIDVTYCRRCGLPSNYPNAVFDDNDVCHLCQAYDSYKHRAEGYFQSMDDLSRIFEKSRASRSMCDGVEVKNYDCLALLSGGKDSTYMLARLVDMGLKVLTFTLDNGYISDEAKANINRVAKALDVDHVYGSTPSMNAIFVDSLQRHANVCQGCFKTIYTLSMQLAKEKQIPFIVTGLSRGQFFETRLTEELFTDPNIDAHQIDATILRARKEYHRVDDAVSRLLDVECFQDDSIFDEVQFVDFYRYCDVPLHEMFEYLDQRLPWIRPTDTGRSTNCLINDVGIFVHKRDRGFHNYAFPYSWDVRVGHKRRDAALEELDDQIDEGRVGQILSEIGYEPPASKSSQRLVAWYVPSGDVTHQELNTYLSGELPEYMTPNHLIPIDSLPLTPNGKVDKRALPPIGDERPDLAQSYVAPSTKEEKLLAKVWQDVLNVHRVGSNDNFFDLGGDSITAIQIIGRANKAGLKLTAAQLFDALTIRRLAKASGGRTIEAQQELVTGIVKPTPIQRWSAASSRSVAPGNGVDIRSLALRARASQVYSVKLSFVPELATLVAAIQSAVRHHDALRIAYTFAHDGDWEARNLDDRHLRQSIVQIDVGDSGAVGLEDTIAVAARKLHDQLDRESGQLLATAWVRAGDDTGELVLVADHLSIDAASWPILVDDILLAYDQHDDETPVNLPSKTTSFQRWSEKLHEYANSEEIAKDAKYWKSVALSSSGELPISQAVQVASCGDAEIVEQLDEGLTRRLITDLPAKSYRIHDVLLTAVAATLSEWCDRETIRLDVEGHGREPISNDVDVSRTIGWFTNLYPLRVQISNESTRSAESWSAAFDSIRDQLDALPHNGLSYGLLRYLLRKTELEASSMVLFNYLGRAEQLLPADDRASFARPLTLCRDVGVRRHRIEINAMVVAGQLRVTWTYDDQPDIVIKIAELAKRLSENISILVSVLLQLENGQLSAARFPQAKLDSKKLGKLASLLKKIDSSDGDGD